MDTSIRYISGGLLGDFVHQLSVINENYLKTGKKGILYISNGVGDAFRKGIETAYADTYNMVKSQIYIDDYKIHNNEQYDINLSQWRSSHLLYKANWYTIFKSMYNIEWATHPWLHIADKKSEFENTIFVNCSSVSFRIPSKQVLNNTLSKYEKEDVRFLTQSLDDYNLFQSITGYAIPCILVNSLEELVVCINSCKLFIGNLSSPLAFAHAMHKPNITWLQSPTGDGIHQLSMNEYNISMQIVY